MWVKFRADQADSTDMRVENDRPHIKDFSLAADKELWGEEALREQHS